MNPSFALDSYAPSPQKVCVFEKFAFENTPVFGADSCFPDRHSLAELTGIKETDVIAKLEVGRKEFFGINAHGQDVSAFLTLARELNTTQPTFQFLRHAEGDVLNQAARAAICGGEAKLFVDAELSTFCNNPGGIGNALKLLRIQSVMVYTPQNPEGFIIGASSFK